MSYQLEEIFDLFKSYQSIETKLLNDIKNSNKLDQGLYHRLIRNDLTQLLNICEFSQIYLLMRMYFLYKNTPKIEKQIKNLDNRIKNIEEIFFMFLFKEKKIKNKEESNFILNEINSKLFL